MMVENINKDDAAPHGAPKDFWDKALAEYRDAKAAFDLYQADVAMPAYELERAYTGPRPVNRFSITTTKGQSIHFDLPWDNLHCYDRDISGPVREAATECRRAIQSYNRRRRAIYARHALDALYAEHDRLFDVMEAAEERLMALAAPDLEALAVKCQIAFEGDRAKEPCAVWTAGIWSDAVRLRASSLPQK
jgi:hypothetical protein